MKPLRRRSLPVGLAAALLAASTAPPAAFAQSNPGDVPIVVSSPVTTFVTLDSPAGQSHQIYAALGGLVTEETGWLILTDGAILRYGGNILNDGFIELRRDDSSGLIGSIALTDIGDALTFTNNRLYPNLPGTLGGGLLMRGGSIYYAYNNSSPSTNTARLTNGLNHVITNAGSSTAYTGNFSGLQLTNHGDIASVRPGGRLTFELSALSNVDGAGQHENSATGRIFAYDSGSIHFSIRHGGGIGVNNPFNTFTNLGVISTRNVNTLGSGIDGGTIRFSSLVNNLGTGWTSGVFQGNNPEVDWGGRLELAEIRFINTLPPSSPGGTPVEKTLTANQGTIRLERGVTIEGGRVLGDTADARFEIGFGGATAGAYANTFQDVTFEGTFFTNGHVRLLGSTDISAATFRPLVAGGGYTFALGADLALTPPRTFEGRVAFTTDSSVTTRTLTLGATLTAPESIAFGNLALAGIGAVVSPVIRLTGPLDLSDYKPMLQPQAGGQLRLENNTFAFPFDPALSSAGATLVIDNATLLLSGSSLAPLGLNTTVRVENNGILQGGGLLSAGFGPGGTPGGTFHIEQGRLRNLNFQGIFSVGQSVVLENAQPLPLAPGSFTTFPSGFDGGDYAVTFASALNLAGATLRLHSTGTVTLDTTSSGIGLPSSGVISGDRLRLIGRLATGEGISQTQFAAGPSGELHLILGSSSYYTPSGGTPVANTTFDRITVAGDLRLDYQPLSSFYPDTLELTVIDSTGLSVDGRLTVASPVTLRPSNNQFYIPPGPTTAEQLLPSAVAARAFTFENRTLSGLHLRPFDPSVATTVDLLPGPAATVLATADATTRLYGGTFVVQDAAFTFDPAAPDTTPAATAHVAPPGTGTSVPGEVKADGTLILSGIALTGYVSESVTAPGDSYLPRTLPTASQLGTITAQHLTLRQGTQAGTRYESFSAEQFDLDENSLGFSTTRRWTLAPNLVATGDQNLGILGTLRLETGRYSPENLTYARLVVGDGATLTRRSLLTSTQSAPISFVGDSLAADPDLAPLPDPQTGIEARGDFSLSNHTVVFDGGRLEGLTLRTVPAAFSYGNAISGALVQTRATFAATSQLIGTLDHATDAVTRFEAGYTFPLGAVDTVSSEYEPQLLRSTPGLTGATRRFTVELTATTAEIPAPITVPAAAVAEESTRLSGHVTVTGIGATGATHPRARLLLESNGTSIQPFANLAHTDGDLTFDGELDVIVNGRLTSDGHVTFASGVALSGIGRAQATGGFALNGQTLPGTSPGTLTLVGDVTFGATHDLVLEIGDGPWNSDRLVVQGHLAAAGKITLNFTASYNSLASPSSFNPATPLVDATTFNGSFTSFEIQGIDPALFNEAQFAQILPAGLYSAIPEPSTYALIAAAAALLATTVVRRRGYRSAGSRAKPPEARRVRDDSVLRP